MCQRSNIAFVNKETGELVRGHCNAWRCPECGNKKRALVAKAIREEVKHWKRIRFWRFSINHKIGNIKQHRALLQRAWTILCKELRRSKLLGHEQRNFQFVRVFERCKDGFFHFHVLCDVYLHREFVHTVWVHSVRESCRLLGLDCSSYGDSALCGSWVDSKTHFTPEVAAGYITKYISKSFGQETESPKDKRYTKSREIVFFRRKVSQGHWYCVKLYDADFDLPFPLVASTLPASLAEGCTIAHEKPPERPPTDREIALERDLSDLLHCNAHNANRKSPLKLFDDSRNALLD